MVVGGLFQRGGLEQNTGVLGERWQQDGSSHVGVADDDSSSKTLRTTSAGKIFYCNSLILTNTRAGDNGFSLRDGGSGGTTVFFATLLQSTNPVTMNLSTPLKFETDTYLAVNGGFRITMTGWEE